MWIILMVVLLAGPRGVYSDLYQPLDEQIHSRPNVVHYVYPEKVQNAAFRGMSSSRSKRGQR
jgi:hypothetical protein